MWNWAANATQRSWEGSFKNLCRPTRHSHMIFASSTSPTFLWLYKLREPSFPALLGTAATLSPQSTFPGLTLGQCCLIPTPASSWVKASVEWQNTHHQPLAICQLLSHDRLASFPKLLLKGISESPLLEVAKCHNEDYQNICLSVIVPKTFFDTTRQR